MLLLPKKFSIPIFQDRKNIVTNPALLPVSPSYYDRRFPAAAKADAGKARTPLKNYLEVYFYEKTCEN